MEHPITINLLDPFKWFLWGKVATFINICESNSAFNKTVPLSNSLNHLDRFETGRLKTCSVLLNHEWWSSFQILYQLNFVFEVEAQSKINNSFGKKVFCADRHLISTILAGTKITELCDEFAWKIDLRTTRDNCSLRFQPIFPDKILIHSFLPIISSMHVSWVFLRKRLTLLFCRWCQLTG